VLDAVVVGSLLITLLRHSDRVTAACQAQLVNTISSIRAEPGGPAWRQSIFHPFALTARHAVGTVLRVEPRAAAPSHETARYGEVASVDTTAVHDEETGRLAVFAVNRSNEDLSLDIDLRGFAGLDGVEHVALAAGDDTNTAETPDRVAPETLSKPTVDGGICRVRLAAASWNLLRFARPQ
jgi:alpha-L-arabinofuranosidase